VSDQTGEELALVIESPDEDSQARPESEWTVAAIAHAAILVTVALGPAIGIGLLVGPSVVLAIYLAYRSRSDFVSRHAVQALVYQVAGGGALALLGGLGLSAVAAAWGVSNAVSTGLPAGSVQTSALPFTLIIAGTLLSILLSWLAYGLYAALQVYQGRDYRYWLIGDWMAKRSSTDRPS
jgi:uncharacterized Tic20 family protein